MSDALFEHKQHMAKSTSTRLVEYLQAYNVPEQTVIVVAKAAVDKEFSELVGFSKSQRFPESSFMGYKIRVGNDFTLEDSLGKPIKPSTEEQDGE